MGDSEGGGADGADGDGVGNRANVYTSMRRACCVSLVFGELIPPYFCVEFDLPVYHSDCAAWRDKIDAPKHEEYWRI